MKIWERLLIVFVCCTFMLCGVSSVPKNNDISAKAADDISVILTPQQSLALFGRSFTGTYYASNYQQFFTITYDCIGLSTAFVPRTQGGGQTSKMFFNIADIADNNFTSARLTSAQQNTRTCLVYKATFESGSSNTGSQSSPNIEVPLSVSIPSCFGYDQKIYYSAEASSYSERLSSCSVLGTGISRTFYNVNGGSPYYPMRLALTPWKSSNDASELNSTDYTKVSLIQLNIPVQETQFAIDSLDLRLNKVAWNWQIDSDSVFDNGYWAHYIFLECPIIGGYVEPETTTAATTSAPIGSTVTVPPQQTVDLSGIESGVGTMIQEQWDTNYLLRIQIDQLNTIIQQLNSIYEKMVDMGDIAIDFMPPDPTQYIDTNIAAMIDNATTFTVAQMPDINSGAEGVFGTVAIFSGISWVFGIGIFSLTFSVFCWVLFKGRGGQ